MTTPRNAGEPQPARTALAWQRTGVGLLLVAGLLTRGAAERGLMLLVVPAAVVATAGLVVLGVLTPHRRRTTQEVATAGGDGSARGAAALGTGLVVLTAICGLAADLVIRLG
jgi:hypothetical protein